MNISHVEAFFAVWKYGSFSEAAEMLFLPQPTLSNRIKLLENEIGKDLFIRTSKGIKLTEAGKIFLPYAERVIEAITNAKERLTAIDEENDLNIGSTVPVTDVKIFETVIKLFANSTKFKIGINVYYMDGPNIVVDALISHRVDLAFTIYPVIHPDLLTRQIKVEELAVLTSPTYLGFTTDVIDDKELLNNHPLILYKPLLPVIDGNLDLLGIKAQRKLVTNHIEVTKYLIKNAFGIALLPTSLVHYEKSTGQIRCIPLKFSTELLPVNFFLTYRKNEDTFLNQITLFLDQSPQLP